MICCDICEGWFHGKRVGLTSFQVEIVEQHVQVRREAFTGQHNILQEGYDGTQMDTFATRRRRWTVRRRKKRVRMMVRSTLTHTQARVPEGITYYG